MSPRISRTTTLRMAAVFGALALGAGTLSASTATAATAEVTKVKSVNPGSGLATADAQTVVINGTDLATCAFNTASPPVWVCTAKTVKFGTTTVATGKITALSADALKVTVPALGTADDTDVKKNKVPVVVTVGDATKGPKYNYMKVGPTVTLLEGSPATCAPTSETASEGKTTPNAEVTLSGTGFDTNFMTVSLGGKKLTSTFTATTAKFTPPDKLVGYQPLVVTDKRASLPIYAGYCKYSGFFKPTVTATSMTAAITEAETKITLTGTNLDKIKTATFGTTTAKITKVKDSTTSIIVAVPVDTTAATTTAKITVKTKYGEFAQSADITRAPSVLPTITGFGTLSPTSAGSVVDLVGTNFVGLKTVVVTADVGGKIYNGKTIVVSSPTAAKVTLPALPNNAAYKLKVTNYKGESATPKAFTLGTLPTTTTTT